VGDEERDYMYRIYAHDPRAKVNLGIRRRLAPLLGKDRKEMVLMNALLFSLLGTPVIYYGDEIGMGDNIYLGDRNGVRTPMQWSADRNAGFSRANPQQLFLPIIIDYEVVNVEARQRQTALSHHLGPACLLLVCPAATTKRRCSKRNLGSRPSGRAHHCRGQPLSKICSIGSPNFTSTRSSGCLQDDRREETR
jgi:Alpha amylase, catalytic domain